METVSKQWNEAYSNIPLVEVVDALAGDKKYLAEQKRKFIEGETDNPTLAYPNIDIVRLAHDETELLALKDKIIRDDASVEDERAHALAKAYRWRINERVAELRMLKASASGHMRAFDRYSRFVYGAPSRDVFDYTLAEVRNRFLPHVDSANQEVSTAVQDFLALLPHPSASVSVNLPPPELIARVHESTVAHLGHLIDPLLVDGVKHDAEAIKKAFEYALVHGGLHDWKIVVTPNRTAVNTNQEKKEIEIPVTRSVGTQKLRELIVHEVGTHAARRAAGETTGFSLLATGLDCYIPGEEGLATFHEQGIRGSMKEYSGAERYLVIGLAQGLDGAPRDFRNVYTIIYKYHLAKKMIEGKSTLEEAQTKASSAAWRSTLRAFRGTDAKTPGVVFTKDIAYRDGNIKLWQRIAEDPEELKRLSSGKYDPSNERHRFVLDNLQIHEDEFEHLPTDT